MRTSGSFFACVRVITPGTPGQFPDESAGSRLRSNAGGGARNRGGASPGIVGCHVAIERAKIITKPSGPPAKPGWGRTDEKSYRTLMAQLRHLNEKEPRFVLLKTQDEIRGDSDWLDRINIVGRDGHWNFDDLEDNMKEW